MRLRATRTATNDLRRASKYIAQFNPGAARVMVKRIEEAFERLRQLPESGRPGRKPGTRELVIPRTPFIAPYRFDGKTVTILAIIHGRRKWPSSPDRP